MGSSGDTELWCESHDPLLMCPPHLVCLSQVGPLPGCLCSCPCDTRSCPPVFPEVTASSPVWSTCVLLAFPRCLPFKTVSLLNFCANSTVFPVFQLMFTQGLVPVCFVDTDTCKLNLGCVWDFFLSFSLPWVMYFIPECSLILKEYNHGIKHGTREVSNSAASGRTTSVFFNLGVTTPWGVTWNSSDVVWYSN